MMTDDDDDDDDDDNECQRISTQGCITEGGFITA